jgi:hypothetical protein
MIMNKGSFRVAGIALASAGSALAQGAAPAPAAPMPTVAAHTCTKPEFPGKLAPQTRHKKWSDDFKLYVECLKGYIGERNAAIEANSKAAKAAVEEFNVNVTEFNEQIKSLGE